MATLATARRRIAEAAFLRSAAVRTGRCFLTRFEVMVRTVRSFGAGGSVGGEIVHAAAGLHSCSGA